MKVLVTGATGFVGGALCDALLQAGHEVSAAARSSSSAEGLPRATRPVVVGSIGRATDWRAAVAGVEVVFHLAARVHRMDESSADPLGAYREVNVGGIESLARAAGSQGVRRVVFLSTVKVHGEETSRPYRESDPLSARDPYGISKREAEETLRDLADSAGFEPVILRPALVYGPGVKANFLNLMKAVDRGIPLPFASISNSRSLVYLGNLVDALALCAAHPDAAGKTFLISDGEDISTPELVRRIAHGLGRPARLLPFSTKWMKAIGMVAGRSASVERLTGSLVVDSAKIRSDLHWTPPFTLTEGLARTAAWYRGAGKNGRDKSMGRINQGP